VRAAGWQASKTRGWRRVAGEHPWTGLETRDEGPLGIERVVEGRGTLALCLTLLIHALDMDMDMDMDMDLDL